MLRRIAPLLLFWAMPLAAQTFVQSVSQGIVDPKTSYTLTFPKPNTAPCTLIMSARTFGLPAFSDTNGNVWVKAPGHNGLYYTTSCASGANAVTFPFLQASYFQAVIAEYSGVLAPDQASDFTNGIGIASTSPSINAKAGELIIGSGWDEDTNFGTIASGAGFNMHGGTGGVNVFLQNAIQASDGPAISIAIYSADPGARGWHHAVAAFKLAVPPIPPVLTMISLNVKVLLCTLCDGTDDTPFNGSGSIAQTNGPTQNFQIVNGAMSINSGWDFGQPEPLDFTFTLIDSSGRQVGQLEQKIYKVLMPTVTGNITGLVRIDAQKFLLRGIQEAFGQ